MPNKVLNIDGVELNVRVAGDANAAPVVVLHGWGASIASVAPIVDRLAPLGYCVHALDLPGFGDSSLPPEPWGVGDYARLVTHYLDHVHLARVHLIGHSFGGRISIILGADHAERVLKIVLTGSAGVQTPPTTTQHINRMFGRAVKRTFALPRLTALQPTVQHWYRERYGSADYKSAGPLIDTFLRVVREDLVPYAARIQASTLLIWGDQDQDAPLWQGQILEKTIADAGLVVFKGAGHFAYQERISDFIHIVDTFFKG